MSQRVRHHLPDRPFGGKNGIGPCSLSIPFVCGSFFCLPFFPQNIGLFCGPFLLLGPPQNKLAHILRCCMHFVSGTRNAEPRARFGAGEIDVYVHSSSSSSSNSMTIATTTATTTTTNSPPRRPDPHRWPTAAAAHPRRRRPWWLRWSRPGGGWVGRWQRRRAGSSNSRERQRGRGR